MAQRVTVVSVPHVPAATVARPNSYVPGLRAARLATVLPTVSHGASSLTLPPHSTSATQVAPITASIQALPRATAWTSLSSNEVTVQVPAFTSTGCGGSDAAAATRAATQVCAGVAATVPAQSSRRVVLPSQAVSAAANPPGNTDGQDDVVARLQAEVGEMRESLQTMQGLLRNHLASMASSEPGSTRNLNSGSLPADTSSPGGSISRSHSELLEAKLAEHEARVQALRTELSVRMNTPESKQQEAEPSERKLESKEPECQSYEGKLLEERQGCLRQKPGASSSMVRSASTGRTSSPRGGQFPRMMHTPLQEAAATPSSPPQRRTSRPPLEGSFVPRVATLQPRASVASPPRPVTRDTRPASSRASSRRPAGGADEMDEMWCRVLQRFPANPDWLLVKERGRSGVYRLGHPAGRLVVTRVCQDDLQVRVGGGWMRADAFLEKYGPSELGSNEVPLGSRARSLDRFAPANKCWT